MDETLLRSIRGRLLDESEPLAGLLRKCLLLGAETGSSSLRDWARHELNGYGDGIEVPAYRQIPVSIIKMNSISGNVVHSGRSISRFNLPADAMDSVPEVIHMKQPIEELETLAAANSLAITHPSLAYAQMVWNRKLDGDFQQIIDLHFEITGAMITGVLGKIRTQLVDVVADLTADTPLTELPSKEQVDAALGQHIGTQYNTTIHSVSGPTAIGAEATASTGLSVDDAVRLLDAIRANADAVTDELARAELLEAVETLRAEATNATPNTGAVMRKAGRVKTAAVVIGVPALSSAVGAAVEAFTTLAMNGSFS